MTTSGYARLLAILAAGITTSAGAQTAAATVGVLESPCAALAPMPASVSAYLAERAKAEAAKTPPPTPNEADMRVYQAWQTQLLTQDFGGLCRYQAENASLGPATSHRVIYFGDSITELWARRDPGLFTNDTVDRGISGQTTPQMLLRFRADVIALKPKVIHILAGTNDVAGNTGPTSLAAIKNNIMSMVELAQTHHIAVVLGSILPAGKFGWRPEIDPVQPIRTLNEWLKSFAAEHKLAYADYYAAMKDDHGALKSNLGDDGVHPNAQGYALMRPIAEKAVAQALARP